MAEGLRSQNILSPISVQFQLPALRTLIEYSSSIPTCIHGQALPGPHKLS